MESRTYLWRIGNGWEWMEFPCNYDGIYGNSMTIRDISIMIWWWESLGRVGWEWGMDGIMMESMTNSRNVNHDMGYVSDGDEWKNHLSIGYLWYSWMLDSYPKVSERRCGKPMFPLGQWSTNGRASKPMLLYQKIDFQPQRSGCDRYVG